MIEPMRIWGMRRRRGYVLDWAVEGASRGSLLRVRMIRPKAYHALLVYDLHMTGRKTYLCNCILGAANS